MVISGKSHGIRTWIPATDLPNAQECLMTGWTAVVFGNGTWILWHVLLLLAFLMLLGTGVYACLEPEGPGAGPMLMLMVFFLAFAAMLVMTSVNVGLFAKVKGSGVMTVGLFILVSWIAVGLSWTFLFWATDPNYPHMLFPGRALFFAHSITLYIGNLWLLRQIGLQ